MTKATTDSQTLQEKAPEDHVEEATRVLKGMFGRDSVYMIMWAVQLGAMALLTPVITRTLGVASFGRVVAVTAVMQIVFAIATLCLHSSVQWVYEQPDGKHKAATLFGFAIGAAALLTLCADLSGPLWSKALGFGTYGGAVRLAIFWAGLAAMTDAGLAFLRSLDRLAVFSTVTCLQSVISVAASLLLVVLVSHTPTMYVLGQLVTQGLALLVAICAAPPRFVRIHSWGLVGKALAYSLPLLPAALAAFALNAGDRVIMQRYLGPVPVARYQIAYGVGSAAIILLGVLNTVWMPRVFAITNERTRTLVLSRSRDSVFMMVALLLLGVSISSPILLRIWAPANYQPDGLMMVLSLVAVAALPYAAVVADTRILLAAGKTWSLAWVTILAGLLNIVLNVALVPPWHIVGSALATLISFLVLAGLMHLSARRYHSLPRPSTGVLAGMVAATGAALLFTLVPPSSAPWLGVRLVLSLACLAWFAMVVWGLAAGRPPMRLLWASAARPGAREAAD